MSGYYRWTQWIFLQIFNSWFDDDQAPRPADHRARRRVRGRHARARAATPTPTSWRGSTLEPATAPAVVDSYRLAYLDEAIVNWCPALGTVLANEEVTPDGRSDRGNHPVFRRPLKQWKLQITAYADRLLADLDLLDWPESIKTMQRNWIGRSVGATVAFPVEGHEGIDIEVFTTRPDTLFGATYMVLAPEHPLLDEIVPSEWPDATLASDLGDMPRRVEGHLRHRRAAVGGGAALPRVRRAEVGARAAGRRPRQDRRVHRGVRQEPHERLERARSSWPTTCSWGTAPGRSWRCPPTTSATSSSPASSTSRSPAWCARPTAGCASAASTPTRPPTNGPRRTSATASA